MKVDNRLYEMYKGIGGGIRKQDPYQPSRVLQKNRPSAYYNNPLELQGKSVVSSKQIANNSYL